MKSKLLAKKKFIKKNESFVCDNCGFNVPPSFEGSCRNHCPKCLYSKHLDINPGDREANCGGLMIPVDIEKKDGIYKILHKCIKCSFERKNRVSSDDDIIGYYEKKNKKN